MSEHLHIRASDEDRERAARDLREHFAAGRLGEEELAQRLEDVYGARTLEQLQAVRSDLPALPLSASDRRIELAARQAELRAKLVQRAGGSLTPFVICTVIWATTGGGSFWPAFLLIAPIIFIWRNLWRLHGPAPELDRVEAELRHGHRRGRRSRLGPGAR